MSIRKTRIVCVSDSHNQTPKLPPGDVLIHAGDLTNQGSYSELKKTVEWLEKANFEAKIVIAGNHDTTLDEAFFSCNDNKWKWPQRQDPVKCRKLLTESSSITYLENEAAIIHLTSPSGPRTRFKIFGSPCSPGKRGWAFQYGDEAAAERLWRNVEDDVDIVVTHTPAYGHRDKATKDNRTGCPVLSRRLSQIRPMLHICGHIHEARGAERVRWGPRYSTPPSSANRAAVSPVESVAQWKDPGVGNKKLSLFDLTAKSGCRIDNTGSLVHHNDFHSLPHRFETQPDRVKLSSQLEGFQHAAAKPIQTPGLDSSPSACTEEAAWIRKAGGEIEHRSRSKVDYSEVESKTECFERRKDCKLERNETAVINAALLSPRIDGKAMLINKPIVVDVELPVWDDTDFQL